MTLVWVGRGEAERQDAGTWVRVPEFDYEFSVVQRRYATEWISTKTLRRLHPDYDGSAGPREQVYSFRIQYAAAQDGTLTSQVESTLGNGAGTADREFRESRLEMQADVSAFAPFDAYRILQHYQYEEGTLTETVELVDTETSSTWVRNQEQARLFGERTYDAPPSAWP